MTSPKEEVGYRPANENSHPSNHTSHSASASSSDRYSSAAANNHLRRPDSDLSDRGQASAGAEGLEDEDDQRNKDVQIAATEAARRRHFKALRTAKACDVCKIRKVKCDGGEPCAACRAHSSACVYSQTTRTRLLSLSAAAGGGSHSASSGSPSRRQTPNHHDTERPTYSDQHFGGRLGPYERQSNMYGSSDSPSNAYASSSRYSTAEQRRPLSSPAYGAYSYPYATGSPYGESRLPESADRGGESRTPYDARAWPNSTPTWNGSVSRRILPAISDLHSGNRWTGHENNHHGPIRLAPLNGDPTSPPNHASRGGSGYSDARDLPPPNADSTASPGDRSAIREHAFVEQLGMTGTLSRGHSTEDEPPSKRPRLNNENAVKQSGSASPLRGRSLPRVRRGPENVMGMSGVITTSPEGGLEGLRWWGPSSFLAYQVRLMQLIQHHEEATSDGQRRPSGESAMSGDTGFSQEVSTALWLWGANDIILDNPNGAFAKSPQLDIMFLPSSFAERFLQSYCIAVHPLYPFYDLARIRQSIQVRFAGGVTYNADRLEFAYSTVEQKLDHARDLLVLAMGARIEGGNGDAHLPKPVAETWATLLSKRSKALLSDLGFSGGSNDIIKLWILHCLYSSMTGDVEQEYIAIGHATSIALALGLHRSCVLTLAEVEDETVRTTFQITYSLERSISLRLGRPSRMAAVKYEIDPVILPESPDFKIARLRALADLGVISEAIYSLYHHQPSTETQVKARDTIWQINRTLDGFRHRLPEPLASFDVLEDEGPISMESEIGEMALLKFDLAIEFYSLRIIACLSTLSREAYCQITGSSSNDSASSELDDTAESCIRAASTLIRLFNDYYAKLPYLPFVGHLAFCFLYVAPVLYMAILRDLEKPAAKALHLETAYAALRVLEKVDHASARVSYNMIKDILAAFGGDSSEAVVSCAAWSAPSLTHLDRMPNTEKRSHHSHRSLSSALQS